jgi:DNA-binding NtrC family response regulator
VETAASAEDALSVIQREPFDLVFTDLRLEGESGIEVLKGVKTHCSQTEVVMMTAFGSIESAVEAMQLGAQNYLRKPFEAADVIRAAKVALDERKQVSERLEGCAAEASPGMFAGIIGTSKKLAEVLDLVRKVATTESTVLITGETGTGKELVGRAVHRGSSRKDHVFCAVNSAAIPETLLESELFGHRRGAFTGASSNKKGLFEHAHEGTVFLDEVAEMPLSMQAKLLRFLQTGEIRPVGGESTRYVDVRLITATNKDLEKEVAEGRFREDLYYRIAVIPVHMPALRDRPDDIPPLATSFLRRFSAKLGLEIDSIDDEALKLLSEYAWPGNVRELENMIERGVALCQEQCLKVSDFPERLREQDSVEERKSIQSLQALERAHILKTLDKVGWNRKRAAELLQISTTTLWRRLKEFGIDRDGMRHSVTPPR